MQEAVQNSSEEASRLEREAADRRVIAAEKDVLLQSQMCVVAVDPFLSLQPLTQACHLTSHELLQHVFL